MTEENKENCNFQQNYNVFGLDDKPCCYLYHKYCDEIDSCYFKRCKRLEQENKDLKKQIESDKGLITVGGKQQYEYLQKIDELEQENKELKKQLLEDKILDKEIESLSREDVYRSALKEIKEIAIRGADGNDCTFCYSIFKKINEVLNDKEL
jgi:hypothetical protein